MKPCLPCSAGCSALLGRGVLVAWAALMVLLLWQFSGTAAVSTQALGYGAALHPSGPAPHQGLPVEQATASAEAESEPGRSRPSGCLADAGTALRWNPARESQVSAEALSFHAQRPRRPLGQAPPRLA